MKIRQFIKKGISVPLYLIVIYYLLPFRPMYLYYSAHHGSAEILNEYKQEKANQDKSNIVLGTLLHQNNDTFPKKDGVRFFFKSGFVVTPLVSNSFVFFTKSEIRSFLQPCYQPPLVLFALDRGPPFA